MTNLEAKQALARKLNIDYADIANNDLITETDIQDWVNQGAMQAYDADFWDFAEHSKTATLAGSDITAGYVSYPQDIAPSSIYYLTINAKEYNKKNFVSFKKLFENDSANTEKIWAEHKRLIFFNTNVASSGHVIDIYGKRAFRRLSADGDLLPFSPDTDNEEYSGNQACILFAYAEALGSEKKKNPSGAEVERKKAREILAILSGQLKQGRASEQSKDRPMFDVPDFFQGNQGNSDIGKFTRS